MVKLWHTDKVEYRQLLKQKLCRLVSTAGDLCYASFFKKIFIYLAPLGLSWGMQVLVPWRGIKPRFPTLGARSLIYWTTKKSLCDASLSETSQSENIRDSVIKFPKCVGKGGEVYILILCQEQNAWNYWKPFSITPILWPLRSFLKLIWETVREIQVLTIFKWPYSSS